MGISRCAATGVYNLQTGETLAQMGREADLVGIFEVAPLLGYGIDFVDLIYPGGNTGAVQSAGKQIIAQQVQSYKSCVTAATTEYNHELMRAGEMADTADSLYGNNDPMGGPLGPTSLYPGGSTPPVSPRMRVVGR